MGSALSGETAGDADYYSFESADVNFVGHWNNGTYAKGSFDVFDEWGFQTPQNETGDLSIQATPEPGTLLLLGTSLIGLAGLWKRIR